MGKRIKRVNSSSRAHNDNNWIRNQNIVLACANVRMVSVAINAIYSICQTNIRQSVTNVENPNQMRDKTHIKSDKIEAEKYEYEILTGAKREW